MRMGAQPDAPAAQEAGAHLDAVEDAAIVNLQEAEGAGAGLAAGLDPATHPDRLADLRARGRQANWRGFRVVGR